MVHYLKQLHKISFILIHFCILSYLIYFYWISLETNKIKFNDLTNITLAK